MKPSASHPSSSGTSTTALENRPGELVRLNWDDLVRFPDAGATPREMPRLDGVVIGALVAITEHGEPVVAFPGNPAGRESPARGTVPVSKSDVGRDVALMFEAGDPCKPIILGFLQTPTVSPIEPEKRPVQVEMDGERMVFTAQQEMVFRCGDASITLTRAGKVLIRGAYLLSRSSGVNRIKGGSVQIN